MEAVRQIQLPRPMDGLRLEMLLSEIEWFNAKIKQAEAELDKLAEDHAGVALLRSIPGVGARTAEAVAAYIDDPQRFGSNKKAGAYFGLVPCQDATGDKNRLGHITRQGPPTVRKLLVEAAWQGIRRSPTLRAYCERVRGGKKERSKIALVATARHLVVVMQAMLKSGEPWREEGAGTGQEAAAA
jgi:transposase